VRELKIIVCIKPVPDPESPSSTFEIDSETKKVNPVGIPPVINPFDENALEAALQIKDSIGGRVVAISLAERSAITVLRKVLSAGADGF
jgi:electron transfer flavoprotein beta subunit